jgi:hypothetical protein
MSVMNTFPVFKCTVCGRAVTVTKLQTSQPDDPQLTRLMAMMKSLEKIAMCPHCLRAYNYYAGQGRSEEFLRSQLAPVLSVYNPKDNIDPNQGRTERTKIQILVPGKVLLQ